MLKILKMTDVTNICWEISKLGLLIIFVDKFWNNGYYYNFLTNFKMKGVNDNCWQILKLNLLLIFDHKF